ncbi:MAG: EamA family transporter [Lachnospiraceae bacterium]|nr:EamA family transporter [Lachnospiraceae bacterium]
MNKQNEKKKTPLWVLIMLQASLLFSSLSGVCSKLAAQSEGIIKFLFWYGMVLFIMFGYAVIWQQILKRMPLTVAYANKPVGLIWGMIWGTLIFGERITWNMILGAGIIFVGIFLVVTADGQ